MRKLLSLICIFGIISSSFANTVATGAVAGGVAGLHTAGALPAAAANETPEQAAVAGSEAIVNNARAALTNMRTNLHERVTHRFVLALMNGGFDNEIVAFYRGFLNPTELQFLEDEIRIRASAAEIERIQANFNDWLTQTCNLQGDALLLAAIERGVLRPGQSGERCPVNSSVVENRGRTIAEIIGRTADTRFNELCGMEDDEFLTAVLNTPATYAFVTRGLSFLAEQSNNPDTYLFVTFDANGTCPSGVRLADRIDDVRGRACEIELETFDYLRTQVERLAVEYADERDRFFAYIDMVTAGGRNAPRWPVTGGTVNTINNMDATLRTLDAGFHSGRERQQNRIIATITRPFAAVWQRFTGGNHWRAIEENNGVLGVRGRGTEPIEPGMFSEEGMNAMFLDLRNPSMNQAQCASIVSNFRNQVQNLSGRIVDFTRQVDALADAMCRNANFRENTLCQNRGQAHAPEARQENEEDALARLQRHNAAGLDAFAIMNGLTRISHDCAEVRRIYYDSQDPLHQEVRHIVSPTANRTTLIGDHLVRIHDCRRGGVWVTTTAPAPVPTVVPVPEQVEQAPVVVEQGYTPAEIQGVQNIIEGIEAESVPVVTPAPEAPATNNETVTMEQAFQAALARARAHDAGQQFILCSGITASSRYINNCHEITGAPQGWNDFINGRISGLRLNELNERYVATGRYVPVRRTRSYLFNP